MVASVVVVVFLAAAIGGAIWRYEVALGQSDIAQSARANALEVQSAATFFWRERETMNEYLLQPRSALLAELARDRRGFNDAINGLHGAAGSDASRELAAFALAGNARVLASFATGSRTTQRPLPPSVALARLKASEPDVLLPLDGLQTTYLHEASRRQLARTRADTQALTTAIVAAGIAIGSTVALALLGLRLLAGAIKRRDADTRATSAQSEFATLLQSAEEEHEVDDLLKRQLDRSLVGACAVVLRKNNSLNRLFTTTADAELTARASEATPRSCLAMRLGRPHQQGANDTALVRCELCGTNGNRTTCYPLLVGGEVIGATLIEHPDPLSESERASIGVAVGQAGPVLANLRNLALARIRAATDALTGLPNSRELQDTLKRMAAHALRTGSPLAALLLDLDHFKQINDEYGHAVGDDVLAAFGTTIQTQLRASDFIGRYGGEEFVALLPDTDREQAAVVAEKLRLAVANIILPTVKHQITASIGVAILPDDAADSITVLRQADRALYMAKNQGRNRVVHLQPNTTTN